MSYNNGNNNNTTTYNMCVVEKNQIWGMSSHQMERRQLCLVFINQIKQVGFKVSYKGVEGSWVLTVAWRLFQVSAEA